MEDELDRVLSKQDEIMPSSGFVLSVMDAVRREVAASEPTPLPPIAFPWVRALPVFAALVAVLVMLMVGFVEVIRMPATVSEPLLPPAIERLLAQANVGWVALALLLAFFSTMVSMRFAAGKR